MQNERQEFIPATTIANEQSAKQHKVIYNSTKSDNLIMTIVLSVKLLSVKLTIN